MVGSIVDVMLVPTGRSTAPQVNGFVASVDRRRIFVHKLRVGAIDGDGVHLAGGTVDLRRFQQRSGELSVTSDLMGARLKSGTAVRDVAFEIVPGDGSLEVAKVAVGSGSRFRFRPSLRFVPWDEARELFALDPNATEVARFRNLHKADAARRLGALTESRRSAVVAELDVDQLADVLEEMPERDQVRILARLDQHDALAVLAEMETDDAIDLLKELPGTAREEFLQAMEEEDAARFRVLLRYREDTAGGLMTPEPVIVDPEAPVAEVIARLRDSDLPPALAARVYVCEPPLAAPTGAYRGSATLQRLLQEPPSRAVEGCVVDDLPTVRTGTSEREVAEILARYDLLSIGVLDARGGLVGVVTIDDVLHRFVERSRKLTS